jgi:hypothetical protein
MLPFSSVVLFAMYFYAQKMGDIEGYILMLQAFCCEKMACLFEAISNVILNYVLGKLLGVNGIIWELFYRCWWINFGLGHKLSLNTISRGLNVLNTLQAMQFMQLLPPWLLLSHIKCVHC